MGTMRTFGIEIEMVGKTRSMIAKAVVGGKVEHVVDEEDDSLTREDVRAPNGSIWRVEDDDSLRAAEQLRAAYVRRCLDIASKAGLP